MTPDRPYEGREVTFATMHGKESVARDAFRDILGATVSAPPRFDTDRFGTFAGEVARTLSPLAAARAKAVSALQLTGTGLALASEGSFTAGFSPVVENREILLFVDDSLGLELIEGTVATSAIPGGRRISTAGAGLDFARSIGFPDQGLIVQEITGHRVTAHKDVSSRTDLARLLDGLFAEKPAAAIAVLPDYRAHRAPSRALTIRGLAVRMATRLATRCPECQTPGFGHISLEHGLPCSMCSSPTHVVAAELHGCGGCDHRRRVAKPAAVADPAWCDSCNP